MLDFMVGGAWSLVLDLVLSLSDLANDINRHDSSRAANDMAGLVLVQFHG